MKIIKKLILFVSASLLVLFASAQNAPKSYTLKDGWGIGLGGAVIQGAGVSVSKGMSEKLTFKVGFNSYSYKIPSEDPSFTIDGTIKFGRVYLGADFHPWANIFSVGGGLMINNLNATAVFTNYDEVEVAPGVRGKPSQPGSVTAVIAPTVKSAPYFNIGLGRALPNKRLGFRFEIGAIYQGKLKAEVSGTETVYLTPTGSTTFNPADDPEVKKEVDDINKQLEPFSFMPYLSLEITIKIK